MSKRNAQPMPQGNREIPIDDYLKILGKKEFDINILRSDNIRLLSEIGSLKKRNETLEAKIEALKNDKTSGTEGSNENRKSSE